MRSHFVALILIVILGGALRLLLLESIPPAIFRDEAEKGYNAYAMMKTGRAIGFRPAGLIVRQLPELAAPAEIQVQHFPLFINVFGVYTSALYQYAAAPLVGLLGLNNLSARLPAALIGTLTIVLLFLLAREMESSAYGLVCAFLLAISPWHLMFSRWAQQAIFLPMLLTLGIYFFILGLKGKSGWWILSAVSFALGYYAYSAARLFIPILLVTLVIMFIQDIKRHWRTLLVSASLFLAISLPIFLFFLGPEAGTRFHRISILSLGLGTWQTVKLFFTNWLLHYSPSFLFLNGDPLPRHSLIYFGQLHIFEAPFLLLGLLSLIGIDRLWPADKNHNKSNTMEGTGLPVPYGASQLPHAKIKLLLLVWFLVFPVSASLTREGLPHALRCIVALPMLQLVVGRGLLLFSRRLANTAKSKGLSMSNGGSKLPHSKINLVVYVLLIIIICVTIAALGYSLFFVYPSWSAPFWQYGVKQALDYLDAQQVNPDTVYFSGNITFAPYLVMFYEKIPPRQVIEKGIDGLKYNFLPPYLNLNEQWDRFPPGSYLVLYPGELEHHLPETRIAHLIYYPPAYMRLKLPALIIYKK